jgi:RHS repeat-associated protein
MTASTSVHSNALNFMSFMKSGVDPRTGQYTVSVSLPDIQTNDLRGPGFALALAFNPLNPVDSGFGMGWNLQLSQYTLGNNMLSLSTGETFKVNDSDSGQLLMTEKKLDSFHFYKDSSTRYRVMHTSGLIEILELHGSAESQVALPVEIYSPTGHKLTLLYATFNGTYTILESISDASGQILLKVKRSDSLLEILLQPFAGADGGPLARFAMTLRGSDKHVTQITLPTEDEASWRFDYRPVFDHLCIIMIETPTGGHEDVFYQDTGHQFPEGNSRTPLPRVTRHLTSPGFGQPMVDVRYTYPEERNFLGFGLSINWTDDGLDNLYKYNGPYEYQCVESLWVGEGVVRSIERTFNRFHLLTSEKTIQNNNVQEVKTRYNIQEGASFEAQLTYYQLPKDVETRWSQLDDATRLRSETVSNTYYPNGNMKVQTQASGVVETSTYFPPDLEGFIRQLESRTVTPAASSNGEAPTLRTRYRYLDLPPLADSGLANWSVIESETLVQLDASTEQELQRTDYDYINKPDDAFLHGRPQRQTVTLNAKSTITDYLYSKLDSPELGVPVQQTTETLSTDFDTVSKSITQQHSLLTAQQLLSRTDGVETHYAYDVLNRVIRETVAPGTDFEASRKYEYTLCASVGQQAEQLHTNAKGVKTRTLLDGLGRSILEERDHFDSELPSRTRQTYAAVYDAWNNLSEETEFDWWDGGSLTLRSQFKYDEWAQQSCVIGPDGVEEHQNIDPIGTHLSNGPIQRSWRQGTGATPMISGVTETWLNLFGKPSQIQSLDAAQQVIGTLTYVYDGLGRCTEQRDELKHITLFSYDPWSRVVSSTLPDDTIVSHTYATHSRSELPATLTVTANTEDVLVGEQHFDGLERLTQVEVGTRTERFIYNAGQMQASQKITPAGTPINYEYNLLVSDLPTVSQAPDEAAAFSYDKTSARLKTAQNEQGTRQYDYNDANQLLSERWIDTLGKTWETLYVSSLQGRQLKRTDLKQASTSGLDTLYHYDGNGRTESIDQGQLQASFEYDSLGRLSLITSRDLAAGTTLVTGLNYDDQNRETLRTLRLDQQPPRTLTQTWQLDGLLESRHLQQDELSLLNETFTYDTRGRLTEHVCSGTTLPRSGDNREITRQLFLFDALDNITMTRTTFADNTTERASFTYANDDPCRLEGVTYTPARTTANPAFTYDLNGNQLNDERGQRLSYDSQSRLSGVESSQGQTVGHYRYDSHDHLITSQSGNQSETLRFYQDDRLINTVQDDQQTQFLYYGDQPLGQQQPGNTSQTLLLLTDAHHSVLGEAQQADLRTAVYTAYGERHSNDAMQSPLAFNGEVRDEVSGWYLLGQGYRAYNPGLMRFHSPDSLSPFGSGGVNPYTYCLGNPIAMRDPTGHESIGWSGRLRRPDEDTTPGLGSGGAGIDGWVGVALGALFVVWGVVSLVGSAGTAAPLSLALMAAGTGLAAGSTAASAVAAVNGDEDAARWGMYLGIASIVPTVGAGAYGQVTKMMMKAAAKKTVATAGGIRGALFTAGQRPIEIGVLAKGAANTNQAVGSTTTVATATARAAGTQTASAAVVSTQAATKAIASELNINAAGHATKLRSFKPPTPATVPPTAGIDLLDQLKIATAAIAEKQSPSQAVATANTKSSTSNLLAQMKTRNGVLIRS